MSMAYKHIFYRGTCINKTRILHAKDFMNKERRHTNDITQITYRMVMTEIQNVQRDEEEELWVISNLIEKYR